MWFLIIDNEVVGQVDQQKKVYGAVLHYIRERTNAAPSLVRKFEHIFSPEGCYYTKEGGVYNVRLYRKERGTFYDCYIYTDEFTIHVSEFDNRQSSNLKMSYLEAVKKEQLLKPVLVKSPNA
jgi:hypothetical protein